MKYFILLILIMVLISGCGTGTYTRYVADCRQCNSNEFCKEAKDGFNHDALLCIKYGDGFQEENLTEEICPKTTIGSAYLKDVPEVEIPSSLQYSLFNITNFTWNPGDMRKDINQNKGTITHCEEEMKFIYYKSGEGLSGYYYAHDSYQVCYRCQDINLSIMPGILPPGDWVCPS